MAKPSSQKIESVTMTYSCCEDNNTIYNYHAFGIEVYFQNCFTDLKQSNRDLGKHSGFYFHGDLCQL